MTNSKWQLVFFSYSEYFDHKQSKKRFNKCKTKYFYMSFILYNSSLENMQKLQNSCYGIKFLKNELSRLKFYFLHAKP